MVALKGGCGRAVLVECLLLVVDATVIRWLTSSSGRRIRDAALTMMGIRSVCLPEHWMGSAAEQAAFSLSAEPVQTQQLDLKWQCM